MIRYYLRMPTFNRHRIDAFVRFVVHRFLDERCLQSAGALALTSLFALVPLITVALGILTVFPGFARWRDEIAVFIFANFVPATGNVVRTYFSQFADNASKVTVIGILILIVSAVALMLNIEDTFNRIWRVTKPRKASARLAVYWSALTLGPLLLVAVLTLSSYVFALPWLEQANAQFSLKAHLLGWLPFLLQWIVLAGAYVLIPNRRVRVRHALIGGLLTALLFEAAKHAFAAYVINGESYQQIYGALAVVPIFIFWIYLVWILVLLGASITASMAAFEYCAPKTESDVPPDGSTAASGSTTHSEETP